MTLANFNQFGDQMNQVVTHSRFKFSQDFANCTKAEKNSEKVTESEKKENLEKKDEGEKKEEKDERRTIQEVSAETKKEKIKEEARGETKKEKIKDKEGGMDMWQVGSVERRELERVFQRENDPQRKVLRELGFTDEVLIEVLLKKHHGDLNACLDELFH
jgi:hypothetical protein